LIDMGCRFQGYCADLTRSFYLGKMLKLYKHIYNLVLQAKTAAQALVRPGVRARDIDAAVRRVFKQARVENLFLHSTGHGVGITIHESPSINRTSADSLREGMVITIEPGLYFSGKFGVRIEDTLLVTKKGYTILTK
jgi:Xaa-Pro aminopeptidase